MSTDKARSRDNAGQVEHQHKPPQADAAPAPSAFGDERINILLVDDETILLEMIRDDLQRYGYEIIMTNNGEAALRELQSHKVDAICCDIKMPGLNGRQIYDWISASRPEYTRRIIFMTGDVINQSLQYFLEQEHLTCLNKPFALRELRQALQTILSKI